MTVERINPANVHDPVAYTHAVKVSNVTLIYTAGQVARDQDRNVVGVGDFRAQVAQAFENLKRVLEGSGASMHHVFKMSMFIVNYTPELRPIIAEISKQYFGDTPLPANTLVGVQALAHPDMLFEIEAVAAI